MSGPMLALDTGTRAGVGSGPRSAAGIQETPDGGGLVARDDPPGPDEGGRGGGGWTGGLRARLVVWFLLLSLIPLFGSNTLGYLRSTQIVEGLVQRYLDGIADVQALHVRDQVERHRLYLQAVSAGNAFLAAAALELRNEDGGPMGIVADLARTEEHLDRKLEELSAFQGLYLLAPDGALLASVTDPGISLPPPTLFLETPESEVVTEGAGDGEGPRIHIAVPVYAAGATLVGYLAGSIFLGHSPDFLELPEHVAGSIESFVVDGEGRPLFVSHPHGNLDYSRPLESPALAGVPGMSARYLNREGEEVIGTSVPIEGGQWRLLTEAPVIHALGELRELRSLSIFLELFFVFVVVALAWVVAGGIVAPVRRLVTATRQVGQGDLDVRVESTERDEIGELGKAFNEMTADLARISRRVGELHRKEIERAHQLATVGELASGVAHEIKNPVVGISNGLDLIQRNVEDDRTLAPIADEMKRQVGRIESAIRDLLAFARPALPTLVPADAGNVLERAVRLVQPAAEKAGVGVEIRIEDDLEIRMDEELVRQALVNLMMNAVHATAPGGEVRASARRVGDDVEFRIRDTGRGVPPDDLEQIFKPFFTTRHSGTGLGLSISREIVERHGGRIEVESEVGVGSTFSVLLPLNLDESAGDAAGAAPSGEEIR